MKRYYKLGESEIVCNKFLFEIMIAKDLIQILIGKENYNKVVRDLMDDIREEYGFNYRVSSKLVVRENALQKNLVELSIWECELNEESNIVGCLPKQDENGRWYIEE